jgi:hypothetical protein
MPQEGPVNVNMPHRRPKRAKRGSSRGQRVSERDLRERILDTIHLMREGKSLTSASREVGISREAAIKYSQGVITKRGRVYKVRQWDRLRRDLLFYDAHGQVTVVTHSSRTASKIARYHNAVRGYLIYGDDAALREFEGESIAVGGKQLPFITDKRTLSRLARAGELNFLDIYVK